MQLSPPSRPLTSDLDLPLRGPRVINFDMPSHSLPDHVQYQGPGKKSEEAATPTIWRKWIAESLLYLHHGASNGAGWNSGRYFPNYYIRVLSAQCWDHTGIPFCPDSDTFRPGELLPGRSKPTKPHGTDIMGGCPIWSTCCPFILNLSTSELKVAQMVLESFDLVVIMEDVSLSPC